MVMGVYTFIAHVAITFHMTLVREFGGISAVLVGNFRKALTIYLSFLLFPKPQSVWYMVGAVLVFGGLFGQEYYRELLKHQNSARNSSNK
jgi:adenosine 3'-phospho 5'-phosphosulfate transporter B3